MGDIQPRPEGKDTMEASYSVNFGFHGRRLAVLCGEGEGGASIRHDMIFPGSSSSLAVADCMLSTSSTGDSCLPEVLVAGISAQMKTPKMIARKSPSNQGPKGGLEHVLADIWIELLLICTSHIASDLSRSYPR